MFLCGTAVFFTGIYVLFWDSIQKVLKYFLLTIRTGGCLMKKMLSIVNLKNILKFVFKPSFRRSLFYDFKGVSYQKENNISDDNKGIVIIQRPTETVGTFSDYLVFLYYIEKIIMEGKIPVIDRMTNKNFYLNGGPDDNTWEYFFEQPCGIGLHDIHFEKTQVMRAYTLNNFAVSLIDCTDINIIHFWRSIAKKYIRLNAETKEHVDFWKRKILDKKKVLGVSIREGYQIWFDHNMASGHAHQLDAVEMVSNANEKLKEWNCDYIFLMCQSDETVNLFKNIFTDKLLIYPRKRSIVEGYKAHSKRTISEEMRNELDYITEINILASCNSVLCSNNSGTQAAFIISEGFDHFECLNGK